MDSVPKDKFGTPIPTNYNIWHAKQVIADTYGDTVSVEDKDKDLLKFGRRTTVGTGWETLSTAVGTETAETFVSDNLIDTVVAGTGDTGTLTIEGHTISGGETTFTVQSVTLTEGTPVSLTTPLCRVARAYNTGSATLVGPIYIYEDNTGRDDDKTHLVIEAGENQSQKAATTISSSDSWIVSACSMTVLAKVTKYMEARIEVKPVSQAYFRPITQTFGCTDTTGTVIKYFDPYLIVPKNYDVRIAVKTNTSAVDVAGGIQGYLAKVIK